MRIAVLGAAGQLGRDLCPRLSKLGEVLPLTRANIDLAKHDSLPQAINTLQPDVFVNCAAYNLVDKAETEPDVAFAVNTLGIRTLAKACGKNGVRVVHFSTDYVFGLSNNQNTPLTETDLPGPVSTYGVSKLAGEFFVLEEANNPLVIRTCGLYGVWGSGGKGGNFVETMLRLANQGTPLRVVNDQRCTPSSTVDLADATVQLIARGAQGLFHVVNSGDCSWYEFAGEIFRQSGLKLELVPITSEEFGAPAKRPTFSVLSTEKMARLLGSPLRPWQEALSAYLIERQTKPT